MNMNCRSYPGIYNIFVVLLSLFFLFGIYFIEAVYICKILGQFEQLIFKELLFQSKTKVKMKNLHTELSGILESRYFYF